MCEFSALFQRDELTPSFDIRPGKFAKSNLPHFYFVKEKLS
jgi:hypothetical protein